MKICICRGIGERDIRHHVEQEGSNVTLSSVYKNTAKNPGAKPCETRKHECNREIRSCVAQCKARRG